MSLGTGFQLIRIDGDWNICRQNLRRRGAGCVGNVGDEATEPGICVVGAVELARHNAATLLSFAEWELLSPTLSETDCRVTYGSVGKVEG